MIDNIPAVIFAGGKSSRMGKDKALLPFAQYDTLVHFQYDRLKQIFNDVYISAKNDKFNFNANLIYDTYTIHSPLGAIISVLSYTQKPTFILSVDTPFVDKGIIQQLINNYSSNHIATIAKTTDGLQPLCGIYDMSFIPIAKQHIQQNNHKLNFILKDSHTHSIYFEDNKPFLNLNYISDYEKALKLC